MLKIENISSKAKQKTTIARYQICYTNSTEGTIHWSIWKNQQPPTVFLHDAKNHKYWIAVSHYAHYRSNTNNKLTFFQKVLVFCDGKQSFKPCSIVLFGVFLFRLDTNNSQMHGRQYAPPPNCILKVGREEGRLRAQALVHTHFNCPCRLYLI